jgi:hypothetical protein
MQDRIAEFESRLASVERRLSALEGKKPKGTSPDEPLPDEQPEYGLVTVSSMHIGRALIIFGGAYLLRAITDFQFVPTGIGILMGATYAVFWLYLAYRKSADPAERTQAVILGAISIVLAMPLLVEAANRFQLLSGTQSVIALAVYCALAFAVAGARNLRSIAWLTTLGGIATAGAIMIVSHSALVVATFLMLLGIGTLWLVYRFDWMALQWFAAGGANAGVLALIALSMTDKWPVEPGTAAIFGTVLLLAFLLSFVTRTHVLGGEVGLFEALQAPVSAGIAFWAASVAAQAGQFSLALIGTLSIVLGACAYVLAFTGRSGQVRGRNYFYYSTLGLVFVLAGSAIILSPPAAAALWSVMALIMAWQSGRTGRVALSLQCTFLLVAAAVHSGVLATGLQALAGDAASWPALLPAQVAVAAVTVACLFLPVAQQSERWGTLAAVPQLTVLALSVWEVGGLAVVVAAPLLAGVAGSEPHLGALAALRTAVLSVASVTLALSSRHPRWPEARWLVYPVLVLVGIKLFAEDFPHGQPVTLFVALAFVGSALLLVAKLISQGDQQAVTSNESRQIDRTRP